jgi:TPR repeat protein
MRPAITLAIAAFCAVGLGIPRAPAETSSWIGHGEPGEAAPKQAPARPAAKVRKSAPGAQQRAKAEPGFVLPTYRPKPAATRNGQPDGLPKLPAPPVAGDNTSSVAKSPAPGEDAAYEAFDQGKYLTALELAAKAAERGDPEANTLIGRIYGEGEGIAKNAALAAQWYARGAELGDAQAMFQLGMLLAEGEGVAKNRAAAAEMFEAAAVRRHPLANYNLALLFLAGDGKPENPYRGFMHMRFAAESGVVVAQYDLGTLYATGTGVDANAFEAAKWIGKAAAAGHAEAELDFGVLLFQGRGVPPDQQRGARLFRSAANQGLAVAQNRLARCYARGAGVEMNILEAARWHLIAKAGGAADASLDELLTRLSKADRAKAQKAADAWLERSRIAIE